MSHPARVKKTHDVPSAVNPGNVSRRDCARDVDGCEIAVLQHKAVSPSICREITSDNHPRRSNCSALRVVNAGERVIKGRETTALAVRTKREAK